MSRQLELTDVSPEAALTAAGFEQVERETLESEIKVYPARAFYPSSIGHPCSRFLVWNFNRHEDKARHSPTLQAIFDEGRAHQPLIYARLEQMGFELVRESDRPVQYRPRGAQGPLISGRPDGRITGFRGTKYRPPWLLEAKSMSGYAWDHTHTVEDLRDSPNVWTRSYYAQGHLGCFLDELERGAFVMKNKLTGRLKFLPFTLDYTFAEALLQKIEALAPMVEQGVDPEPIPYDGRICGDCGFRAVCYPPRDFGAGAEVLDDPAFVEQLEERETLRQAKGDYDQVDRAVKARLKHEGIKFALVGPFVVEGRVVSKKGYTVEAHDEVHYEIRREG